MKIYANINPNSACFSAENQPQPFPVLLVPDADGYHWKGGPARQYRTTDLLFFTVDQYGFKQFDLCDLTNLASMENTRTDIERLTATAWHSGYWRGVIHHAKALLSTAEAEYQKQQAAELAIHRAEEKRIMEG